MSFISEISAMERWRRSFFRSDSISSTAFVSLLAPLGALVVVVVVVFLDISKQSDRTAFRFEYSQQVKVQNIIGTSSAYHQCIISASSALVNCPTR